MQMKQYIYVILILLDTDNLQVREQFLLLGEISPTEGISDLRLTLEAKANSHTPELTLEIS